MANYASLKSDIQRDIKQNGANAITGNLLQSSLLAIINSLGAYYQFAGIANTDTNPGTPDQRVFYIALRPGVYYNFGPTEIKAGQIGFFFYSDQWNYIVENLINIESETLVPNVNVGYIGTDGNSHYYEPYRYNRYHVEVGKIYDIIIPKTGTGVVASYGFGDTTNAQGLTVFGYGTESAQSFRNVVASKEYLFVSYDPTGGDAVVVEMVSIADFVKQLATDISAIDARVTQLEDDVMVEVQTNIPITVNKSGRYVNQQNGNLVAYVLGDWDVAIFKTTVGKTINLHIPKSGNSLCGSIMWGHTADQTSGLVREGLIYGNEAEQNFENITVQDEYLYCTYNRTVANPLPILTQVDAVKIKDVVGAEDTRISEIETDVENLDVRVTALESTAIATPKLALVSEYNLIANELYELFYNGIFDGLDPENYDFMVRFSDNVFRGNHYKEKWQWTPTINDVGTYTVTIQLYSNTALIDTKQITLKVNNPANLTTNNKVCLLIGDSLMYIDGNICGEVYRRLCSNDAAGISDNVQFPAGFNKNNFQFIGTVQSERQPNAWCVGVGGWTADYYNKESVRWDWQWLVCSHDKTDADQHSTYKDSQNRIWRLESIETGRIKVYEISGAYPSGVLSGTLTWVSGGENHSDIVISSATAAPGNPFWINGQVDFAAFAQQQGVSTIDYIVIELGTNNIGTPDATLLNDTRTLINNILASYPNVKICLMTTHKSARDGWNGSGTAYYDWIRFCAHLKALYTQIASEYPNNIKLADMAAEIDTDHCTGSSYLNYNSRYRGSDYRREYLNNALHPLLAGYCMMADTIVRDIVARLTI